MSGFIDKIMGLFGGSGKQPVPEEKKQMIGDLAVFATPMRDGNQFRVAGRIEKVDGERTLVRRFIRADVFASETDALDTSFRKARQIIDQHGVTLFGDGADDRMV